MAKWTLFKHINTSMKVTKVEKACYRAGEIAGRQAPSDPMAGVSLSTMFQEGDSLGINMWN